MGPKPAHLRKLRKGVPNTSGVLQYTALRYMKRGEQIGAIDLLIASHALALDATLVTNYEREFKRVRGKIG